MAGGRLAEAGAKAARAPGRLAAAPRNDPREQAADRHADAVLASRPEGREQALSPTPLPPAPSAIAGRMGPGRALDTATRRYFEPRFGADFSQVRVHSGPRAGASADAMGAEAYTDGGHIVFGPGAYSPASEGGRRLIAHELAHVAQRQQGLMQRPGELFLKAKAVRFQDEPTLDEVSDGKRVLKSGDKGEAVVRLIVALSELGHYRVSIIDERYDFWVGQAVTAFQDAEGLKGKATPDECDKTTFDALDAKFAGNRYAVERGLIGKQKSGKLLDGTDSLDPAERAAANRAVSTEVKAVAGQPLPKFVSEIKGSGKGTAKDKDTYERKLTDIVETQIVLEHAAFGKDKAADHTDVVKLYDWSEIGVIAVQAQKATDALFSRYYGNVAHPALAQGTNIFDAWDDKEAKLKAGGKAAADASADWRVEKIIEGEDVQALDEEHGAVQSRPREAAIIARVKAKLVKTYRAELIETHKGWPGYADEGKIFIQRFKKSTAEAQRADMWEFFYTFIHEYVHTLEDSGHETYRKTKTEKKGNKALREGATEYLARIVWSSIVFDAALRKTIEGPFHDPAKPFTIPAQFGGYAEFANAERLAGIVGIRNFLAAYLLGDVQLIGAP